MEPFFTLNQKTDCMEYSLTSQGKDMTPENIDFWHGVVNLADQHGFNTLVSNLGSQLKPESLFANSQAPRVHESAVGPDEGL
jgi:hypothetical protein